MSFNAAVAEVEAEAINPARTVQSANLFGALKLCFVTNVCCRCLYGGSQQGELQLVSCELVNGGMDNYSSVAFTAAAFQLLRCCRQRKRL
jgi:hypothetical protein